MSLLTAMSKTADNYTLWKRQECVKNLEGRIQTLQTAVQQAANAGKAKAEELQQQNDELQSRGKEDQGCVAALRNQVKQLEEQAAHDQRTGEDLRGKLSTLQQELAAERSERASLSREKQSLQQHVSQGGSPVQATPSECAAINHLFWPYSTIHHNHYCSQRWFISYQSMIGGPIRNIECHKHTRQDFCRRTDHFAAPSEQTGLRTRLQSMNLFRLAL